MVYPPGIVFSVAELGLRSQISHIAEGDSAQKAIVSSANGKLIVMPGYYEDMSSRSGTDLPEWADPEATVALETLQPRGENERVEFMESFPDQARELGKEIAAFATSGGGRIYIGITDAGYLVGLPDCKSTKERDALIRRVEGVLRSNVKPSIKPKVRYASNGGIPVMEINVPRGGRPVYYWNNTPYIRNITESRPATPEEIDELYRSWYQGDASNTDPESRSDLSDLASLLVEIAIEADLLQAEERQFNPWLSDFGENCELWAANLVNICAADISDEPQLVEEVTALARRCEKLALNLSRGLSGSPIQAIRALRDVVLELKTEIVDQASLKDDHSLEVRDRIRIVVALLNDLSERISDNDRYLALKTDEIKDEVGGAGRELLTLLAYPLPSLKPEDRQAIDVVAAKLLSIQTVRVVMDGGQCFRTIRDKIHEAVSELTKAAMRIGAV